MIVPLKILLTDSSLLDHPSLVEQVAKLEKAGHSVTVDDQFKGYDFIAGPNCWLLRPEVAGLFTMAVTNARKIANADQKRSDAHKLTKTSKAPAKRARKVDGGNTKVKGPVEPTPDTLPGQLDCITDPEADRFPQHGC